MQVLHQSSRLRIMDSTSTVAMIRLLILAGLVCCGSSASHKDVRPSPQKTKIYTPDWESLDSRPIPQWYKDAKFGIFMHWGVFSVTGLGVPGFEWQMHEGGKDEAAYLADNYPPGTTFTDLCSLFTARYFNASHWIDIFEKAGAKYIVPVSKHKDGFCNWNTSYSDRWNSVQCGPKRDLIGELESAVRKSGKMSFGVYHGMSEFLDPLWKLDQKSHFKTNHYVATKTTPQLHELVEKYKPDIIWSDDAYVSWEYFNSTNFLAWLFNDSPIRDHVAVNDRWGRGTYCKHGGFHNCQDLYNPKVLQSHYFECCARSGSRWAYNKHDDIEDIMNATDALTLLVQVVSCGGNLLLNIAPTHDGLIMPVFQHLLSEMGMYLDRNAEAIYSSTPWTTQDDSYTGNVWYTQQKSPDANSTAVVYACITEKWPGAILKLSAPKPSTTTVITLLGYSEAPLKWSYSTNVLSIIMPVLGPDTTIKHGWVLKLTNLKQ